MERHFDKYDMRIVNLLIFMARVKSMFDMCQEVAGVFLKLRCNWGLIIMEGSITTSMDDLKQTKLIHNEDDIKFYLIVNNRH